MHIIFFALCLLLHAAASLQQSCGKLPSPSMTILASVKTPVESFSAAATVGETKSRRSAFKSLLSGFMSGCHIGIGSYLSLTVGGQCHKTLLENPGMKAFLVGAIGFPFATLMTTTAGGDIFTGDIFFAGSAYAERRITLNSMMRFLGLVWLGNILGGAVMAALAFYADTLPAAVAIKAATLKSNLSWPVAFVRGILCSLLICMAAFNANSGTSLTDKFIGFFGPISAFVTLGLENSVSNMFTIPFGIMNGANVSVKQYLVRNILPVTLGNLVGGLLAVVLPYAILTKPEQAPAFQSQQNGCKLAAA